MTTYLEKPGAHIRTNDKLDPLDLGLDKYDPKMILLRI